MNFYKQASHLGELLHHKDQNRPDCNFIVTYQSSGQPESGVDEPDDAEDLERQAPHVVDVPDKLPEIRSDFNINCCKSIKLLDSFVCK